MVRRRRPRRPRLPSGRTYLLLAHAADTDAAVLDDETIINRNIAERNRAFALNCGEPASCLAFAA